jgi:hypothetical protein
MIDVGENEGENEGEYVEKVELVGRCCSFDEKGGMDDCTLTHWLMGDTYQVSACQEEISTER